MMEKEKQIALEAVTQAAMLCTSVRQEIVEAGTLEKGDKSPVTVADFGVQALVCHHLQAAFPDDVIVGEEDSAALREAGNESILEQVVQYVQAHHAGVEADTICQWIDAGNGEVTDRYWTLDPIDGTKGFLRSDQYAIALALIENGQPQVAALACPALPLAMSNPQLGQGVVFVAVRGQGATMTALQQIVMGAEPKFTPIQVASADNPLALRFVESVESGHSDHSRQKAIAEAVGITADSLRMDSQAKYGAVARGDATLYLRLPSPTSPDYREKIWDHAAGALVVQEAGGTVTDMHGQPLDFASGRKMVNNRGVIVSNGAMHEAVIAALVLDS